MKIGASAFADGGWIDFWEPITAVTELGEDMVVFTAHSSFTLLAGSVTLNRMFVHRPRKPGLGDPL